MAMTFAQLKARAAVLAKLEGWSEVSPSPDWASLTNRAYEMWSWDSECLIGSETLTSAPNTAEYSLTNSYKNLLDVTFGASGLFRSVEEFERNLSPTWRTQTAATPLRWVLSGFNKLTLIPPPNSAATITVRGASLPPALAAETDIPQVPSLYHEAIALKAAYLHGMVYAQGESMGRLDRMDAIYKADVAQCRAALLVGYERRQPGEG